MPLSTLDRIVIMYFIELLRDMSVVEQKFVVEQIGEMCQKDIEFAGRWFNG